MSSYQREVDFSHEVVPTLGVLVTNLGTPDEPTPQALRRYLAEFLWDRRVVDAPRTLWWLILNGIILRFRPARSAAAYQKIWTDEGSPLLAISRSQVEKLQRLLEQRFHGGIRVALGMRYGKPSIASALEELRAADIQRLLVLPLYPHYSCSTTASTFDAVSAEFSGWRWLPETRFVNHYHDNPAYIAALANSIEEQWQKYGQGEHLLFSFHGTPRRYLEEGDPYYCECLKTARLVAERLELPHERWQVVFQSRFGREEWLKPYTDETLEKLARNGVNRVDVICPGFSADCLETLEEIAEENQMRFLKAGGEALNYIPALNDRTDHIELLASLVESHAQGWPEFRTDYSVEEEAREAEQRHKRAAERGARK